MYTPAPIPENDEMRVQALQECRVLDTEAEPTFDALTAAASELCGVPIALISLVDQDRQWFKARIGIDATQTHRDEAFCSHAILTPEPMIIEDAYEDPRFCESPLVLGPPHIRFYAGVPLELSSGERIGTLCVIDQQPRKLTSDQRSGLKVLAIQATALLELRRKVVQLERTTEQLERARTEADQANQAKSEFLASMSHEIRTPLNGVIGMTELLRDTDLDTRQRRFVEACHASGTSLLGLINDILDLSKIEAGRLELDPHEFDLEQLVMELVDAMAMQARNKGLDMICFIDPRAARTVIGDSTRLRQVLVNLIGNALKFTEKGEIYVRVAPDKIDGQNVTCRFAVTDTGIGIPEDRLHQLFNAFEQADSSMSRRFGGTGLGLTISKSLVEAMGGRIEVDSEVGVGSTFAFTANLPLADDARPQPLSPEQLKRMRVLIADPCQTSRQAVAEMMAGWQITCCTTDTLEQAQRLFSAAVETQQPYDVFLVDQQLWQRGQPDWLRTGGDQPVRTFLMVADTPPLPAEGDQIVNVVHKPICPSRLMDVLVESLCQPSEPDLATPQSSLGSASSEGDGYILLVEDNPINQLFVTEILSRNGYRCDVAENGRQAVDAVQRERYNLILMDCQMPEMDGFAATGAIRQFEAERGEGDHVPIIALTANAIKGDRERCLEAGMDDYLSKPVEVKDLLAKLQDYLSGSDRESKANDEPASTNTTPIPSGDDPLDVEAALQRCMDDSEFLAATLDSFVTEVPGYIDELERLIESGDAESATRAAHSIKGAAGMVTAESLRAVAAELEALGKEGRLSQARDELDQLKAEWARCTRYIDDLQKAGSA